MMVLFIVERTGWNFERLCWTWKSSLLCWAAYRAFYRGPNGEGPHLYLKREDLNHTGSHKINNAIDQVLLAKRLGKKHIIAEIEAGQHGVATATVCMCSIWFAVCCLHGCPRYGKASP
jgi:hypothetical protein